MIIAFTVVFILYVIAPRFKTTELTLSIKDYKLAVKTTQLEKLKIMEFGPPESLYVDTIEGVVFNLPIEDIWKDPEKFYDLNSLFERKKIAKIESEAKWYPELLVRSPLGKMIQESHSIRIASKEVVRIEYDDSTYDELFHQQAEGLKELMLSDSILIDSATIKEFKRSFFAYQGIDYSNEIVIHIYDKKDLSGFPINISLASLFLEMTESFGYGVERIKANDEVIFASGSGIVENIKVDGKRIDFYAYRWILMTETRERFYMVEIGFSPQARNSIRAWEDLRRMFESFRVIS